MQTNLADFIRDTAEGQEADRILRSCVHCGFCTATCPTYQLLGDELEGPRGRIYLMKQVLEGKEVSRLTQQHLDHCLTCRSCETTCPSGVQYGRLVDIGRGVVEQRVSRPTLEKLQRRLLRMLLPYTQRVAVLMFFGRLFKPLLPHSIQVKIPDRSAVPEIEKPAPTRRKMLLLDGCAQPAMVPSINAAAQQLLGKLGIELYTARGAGCCGAVSYHLAAHEEGLAFVRRNIDAWWHEIENNGVEAVVTTASGCGVMVKDYQELMKDDPLYADKAARITALSRDISEVVATELKNKPFELSQEQTSLRVAFHEPCTLQHGLRLPGVVRQILSQLGFEVSSVRDNHLCCGSAGTYSILQKDLSGQLLSNKIQALQEGKPDVIATANIGCLLHLQSATEIPVKHWIELLLPGSAK